MVTSVRGNLHVTRRSTVSDGHRVFCFASSLVPRRRVDSEVGIIFLVPTDFKLWKCRCELVTVDGECSGQSLEVTRSLTVTESDGDDDDIDDHDEAIELDSSWEQTLNLITCSD